jgi:D-alanyl-D-alanine carboxypeptidase
MHAMGAAIDINPVENPWVVGSSIRPPAGERYADLDRGDRGTRPDGVIGRDSVVVGAFAAVGWEWGGSWAGSPDYQHFSARR